MCRQACLFLFFHTEYFKRNTSWNRNFNSKKEYHVVICIESFHKSKSKQNWKKNKRKVSMYFQIYKWKTSYLYLLNMLTVLRLYDTNSGVYVNKWNNTPTIRIRKKLNHIIWPKIEKKIVYFTYSSSAKKYIDDIGSRFEYLAYTRDSIN